MRELETLGFVQGHEADRVAVPLPRPVRRQRGVVEQFAGGMEAAGDIDELGEIFELRLHVLGPAHPEHFAVTGPVEQERKLIGERQASLFGDRPDRMDELKPCFLRLWRQGRRLGGLEERNAEEGGVAL